jgi:hypothetical protein
MKLDTMEKHARKVYDKKIINGKQKSIIKWKYFEGGKFIQEETYKVTIERILGENNYSHKVSISSMCEIYYVFYLFLCKYTSLYYAIFAQKNMGVVGLL